VVIYKFVFHNYRLPHGAQTSGKGQLLYEFPNAGLHNSGSSKGQFININFTRAANIYFISTLRFRYGMEDILKR